MKNNPNGWTRREFIRYGAGTAGALLYSASSFSESPSGPTAKAGNRRPNIILMLADDMGYSDLGCYGSEIHTPHIDALARGGIRFGQFYNTARCCPTRASLLTGLYPHQAGIGHMTEDYGVPAFRGAPGDPSPPVLPSKSTGTSIHTPQSEQASLDPAENFTPP